MVVATQPDRDGRHHPLPEAQRDRFMARIQMGYPTPNSELDMLESHAAATTRLAAATGDRRLHHPRLIDAVKKVYVSPAVKHYIVQIVNATRNSPPTGASPRATLQLLREPCFRGDVRPGLCDPGRRCALCLLSWRIVCCPPPMPSWPAVR